MSWHLLSKFCIKVFLVNILLISKMVFFLSVMPNSSSCSLFLVFKKCMSLLASLGIFPNSAFVLWISSWAVFTRSICSKITWMDGQTSFMDWVMLAQRIFLISVRGLSKVRSFYDVFTLFSNVLISLVFSVKFTFEIS